jgi:hypothetical protein
MEIRIPKSKQVEAILETIYHEGFGFIVVLQTLEFGGGYLFESVWTISKAQV